MAYIDPDGMFGGDRMALLSDGAKFAFPWFWCASNTVGRLELNYTAFLGGPFRQFRKAPGEKQFWEWVAEFHEAHLLFVYQANGQAWGQWDVTERYLPTYKLKADERTPAPIAAEFLKWRDEYQSSKVASLSSKCRIFSNSRNFQKLPEISENFSIGEERRGVGEEFKNLSAANAAVADAAPSLFPVPSNKTRPSRQWLDQQHDLWYFRVFWNRKAKSASRKAYAKQIFILMDEGISADAASAFLTNQAIADKERFQNTKDWEWRQNLYPATWLNGQRWNDEPTAQARDSPSGGFKRQSTAEAMLDRAEELMRDGY